MLHYTTLIFVIPRKVNQTALKKGKQTGRSV